MNILESLKTLNERVVPDKSPEFVFQQQDYHTETFISGNINRKCWVYEACLYTKSPKSKETYMRIGWIEVSLYEDASIEYGLSFLKNGSGLTQGGLKDFKDKYSWYRDTSAIKVALKPYVKKLQEYKEENP